MKKIFITLTVCFSFIGFFFYAPKLNAYSCSAIIPAGALTWNDFCALAAEENTCGGAGAFTCGSARDCSEVNDGNGMCHQECLCGNRFWQGKTLSSASCIDDPLPTNMCRRSYSGTSCQISLGPGVGTFGSYSCSDSGSGDSGSGGGGGGGGGGSSGQTNFILTISPITRTVAQGNLTTYNLVVAPIGTVDTVNKTVALSAASICGSGTLYCNFDGQSAETITLSTGTSVNVLFTVVTTGTTPINTYDIAITGQNTPTNVQNTSANLVVTGPSSILVNDAVCQSFTAPSTVTAGSSFTGTFTLLNSGTKPWTNVDNGPTDGIHVLAIPGWASTWTQTSVPLPSSPIHPGATAVFSRIFTATTTPGTYPFTFQMVQFGGTWFGTQCTKNITVTASSSNPPTVSLTVTPSSGPAPLTTTINWSSTNSPTSCISSWGGTLSANGSTVRTISSDTTFTVTCSNANGNGSASATATISGGGGGGSPVVSISANPTSGPSPLVTTLTWSSTNATSCAGNWGASIGTSGSVVGTLAASKIFTVTCSNAVDTTSDSVIVNVTAGSGYKLSVNASLGGSVVSADSFISCGTRAGGPCSHTYPQDSIVNLQAIPDSINWKFIGWQGACSGVGVCSVTMSTAQTVNALFVPRPLIYQEF